MAAPESAPITVPTTGTPNAVPATAPATAPPRVLPAVPVPVSALTLVFVVHVSLPELRQMTLAFVSQVSTRGRLYALPRSVIGIDSWRHLVEPPNHYLVLARIDPQGSQPMSASGT